MAEPWDESGSECSEEEVGDRYKPFLEEFKKVKKLRHVPWYAFNPCS